MTGQLRIDGIDAYDTFGVLLTQGDSNDLLAYPPLKNVTSINWQEEDGEEVDLATPVLGSRELSISFVMQQGRMPQAFIDLLSNGAYHLFELGELGRSYRLRLVSQSGLTLGRRMGEFVLSFAADFPQEGYTYQAPHSTLAVQRPYALDGVALSAYGVYVLKGAREEIEQLPNVKKNLLRDIESQAGVIYDDSVVRFQTKDVKLDCLMRAPTRAEFWRNYDALLFDLTRPGERRLTAHTGDYACYYKSCSATKFALRGSVWFEFDLTLTFLRNAAPR